MFINNFFSFRSHPRIWFSSYITYNPSHRPIYDIILCEGSVWIWIYIKAIIIIFSTSFVRHLISKHQIRGVYLLWLRLNLYSTSLTAFEWKWIYESFSLFFHIILLLDSFKEKKILEYWHFGCFIWLWIELFKIDFGTFTKWGL